MLNMKMLGKGNTAEVFEYESNKVCKLFFEGYPCEYVELEFHNSKEMYQNNIRIPKPYEIINLSNRTGIIYEKIIGKTLLSIMVEDMTNVDTPLNMFTQLHKNILIHHTQNVIPYKTYLITMLKNKGITSQDILDKINLLPEDDCLLHGDFHPDNILITSDGIPVVIDFMNVCSGPALYDVARTYFLIRQFDKVLADMYLQKMNVEIKDIEKYLEIIEICRKYEG